MFPKYRFIITVINELVAASFVLTVVALISLQRPPGSKLPESQVTDKTLSNTISWLPFDHSILANTQRVRQPEQPDWKEAEGKWGVFEKLYLKRIRQHEAQTPKAHSPGYTFDREFVEIKSPLIAKYLVEYRVFTDKFTTFALRRDGQVIDIGTSWPVGYHTNQSFPTLDFVIMDYVDFIKERGIRIKDPSTALEMIQLAQVVHSHGLSLNHYGTELKASRNRDVWTVTEVYPSREPEVSTGMPLYWEIVVDNQNRIKKISAAKSVEL